MSTFNLMLIPAAQLGPLNRWYAFIHDGNGNMLWEQQDPGYDKFEHARRRAEIQAELIRYERQHQLQLL